MGLLGVSGPQDPAVPGAGVRGSSGPRRGHPVLCQGSPGAGSGGPPCRDPLRAVPGRAHPRRVAPPVPAPPPRSGFPAEAEPRREDPGTSRGGAAIARHRPARHGPGQHAGPDGMAARILHRLRHALAGEGGREERAHGGSEAEDFPESSELEDDTEGLSTRLSGTLSFTSHEEEEDEENEEEDGAGEGLGEPPQATGAAAGAEDGEWGPAAERPGSSLLTRQLQELWRKSRGNLAPQRLLFEVTSASVVSERSSKYVVTLHHLPDPLRPVRQGPRRHHPALLGLRAAEPPPALPLWLRHGRHRLPQEEAAPEFHRRDHRQTKPSLRAVPVPPALHRRDPPLPRVPRVLLPAGLASRAAPDLHRHVPRGPGHLGQCLPAAGPAGGLQLRPLPPDAGWAGCLPPGAGRARRGPRLLRAGATAAGNPR
ncbi:sorting nexin-21 isoform X2 [Rissa tridactyla]|uniref:sorting nexin-21 isoform X2 n=1 Tax=Rissa tridactyla TaxID=75485 RepID=UPI0023BA7C91|nr:sorting nexin-21 isoform X2 [Rissa tridactyla]